MNVQRTDVVIKSDVKRVLLRPFSPTSEARAVKIMKRILALPEASVNNGLENIMAGFGHRHRQLERFFRQQYEKNCNHMPDGHRLSEERKQLIGAYFSMEYSPEAAALFNPSMVWHPDQSGLPPGSRRFILSLRATGEGHISSLAFRSGVISERMRIVLDEPNKLVITPEISTTGSDYQAQFSREWPLAERVIFPSIPLESNGIEDARFVAFFRDDGTMVYYATYTAYDGKRIYSRLLETSDFIQFKMRSLKGPEVQNKGLALFPRKINGRYAMLSRQDNENNYIMFSDDLYRWESKKMIMEPAYPWEFFQLGNSGSPIETDAGWLVLAHAVGPMRKYVLSAFLLDLHDPAKVIGRLKKPLLCPTENEREGYVPNVVYSCGSQLFQEKLIIPYAMSDFASSFAIVDLDELLAELTC